MNYRKGILIQDCRSVQNDEIGQLATAFNQMGRQLKYHVELINQEKEQLSSILTSMTDAVITFNRDSTILLSNPQAERLLQNWYFKNDRNKDEQFRRKLSICWNMSLRFLKK